MRTGESDHKSALDSAPEKDLEAHENLLVGEHQDSAGGFLRNGHIA